MSGLRTFLLALLCTLFLANTPLADTVDVVGTGACEPILGKLAYHFNLFRPDRDIYIPSSVGSTGGYKAVGTGEAVLGRVARKPKGEEWGYGLSYLPFAKDVVAFAVGSKVGITNFSPEQLTKVFSGQVIDWSEVGGGSGTIRVLIRNPNDATRTTLAQGFAFFADIQFTSNAKMLYHDHEMLAALDKYGRSIGWCTISSLIGLEGIRLLTVEGKSPTIEGVRSGDYPAVLEFAFIYKPNALTEPARAFLDFVFSEEGSEILRANGLIPLSRPE